ncbi:MAG: efflux RND transporter periplasmic adaptor subunit [Gemmatimonadota bacterium]
MTEPRDRPDPRSSSAPVNPFGRSTPRARVVRPAAIVLVLLAATALAYRFSRTGGDAPAAEGHVHGAGPATDSGQPVSLDARAAQRIGVTYAPVTSGTLATEVRTVAQVTFDETRVKAISPRIDGWVEELFVNATGQPVRAGEPLLTIDSPMLVTAQEEFLLARRLGADVSGAADETRQGAAELQQAARRRLQYWEISEAQLARLAATGQATRTMTLRAPVSGVVVQKNVLAGQRVMAGEMLYQVADLSTVWLEGEVFERDLAAVHVGQSVTAEFDAFPGEARTGRISYLYPTLNPDTRTARVRVALANPGLRLKPGMYGTIRIASRNVRAGLLVPRSAVLATGERQMVFVRRPDGKLEPRAVVTGLSNDDQTQILSGVALGDTVVRSATFLVDAESNLGSAFGGMGDMPGMDLTAPAKGGKATPPATKGARPGDSMPGMDHAGHEE